MSKSSNGKKTQTEQKTYQLRFEQYLREHASMTIKAGSLAEAAEIARNMTWEEINGLYFDFSVAFEDTTRLYSIASEDGNELISVSDVEDDRSKVLYIEACSLTDAQYGDRIQHASDIELARHGDAKALARLQGVVASLNCKTTEDFVRLFRIVRCILSAGGTPLPEHASSWLSHVGSFRRFMAEQGGDLSDELRGMEDLIASMESMAEAAALLRTSTGGTSARQSASL